VDRRNCDSNIQTTLTGDGMSPRDQVKYWWKNRRQ
jgi:hypothetical protein